MSVLTNPALIPPSGPSGPAGPGAGAPARGGSAAPEDGQAFAAALRDADKRSRSDQAQGAPPPARGLQFSRHALERVRQRGVSLDRSTLGRLHEGVGRAAGKGSRDSLVLVDGTAFVVSVSNRTVVTAVGPEHMREHVFTNIDSAVIA